MGFKYLIPFLLDKVLFQENQQSLTIGLANHDLLENIIRQDDLSLGRGELVLLQYCGEHSPEFLNPNGHGI